MRKIIFTVLTVAMTTVAFCQTIAVQGVLRDPGGRAVDDGFYELTLRLYDVSTSGTSIWEETQSNVEARNGVVALELGSVTPLSGIAFNTQYYIGISVEGRDELSPRIKLTEVPYALAIRGDSNIVPYSGNVGFGTGTPEEALDVVGNIQTSESLFVTDSVDVGNKLNVAADITTGGNMVLTTGSIVFPDLTSINSATLAGDAGGVSNPNNAIITADGANDGNGTLSFNIGPTTHMLIANNGNIGINENSPQAGLHMNAVDLRLDNGDFIGTGPLDFHPDIDNTGDDEVRFFDSAGERIFEYKDTGQNTSLTMDNDFGTSGRNIVEMMISDRQWNIENDGSDNVFKIRDVTAGADRLSIDYSGDVGIGTTSPVANLSIGNGTTNPDVVLHGSTSAMRILPFDQRVYFQIGDESLTSGATADLLFTNYRSSTSKMTLRSTGGLTIFGGGDVSLTDQDGYLILGDTGGENMAIDNNEIMVRNNGAVDRLNIQLDGGTTKFGGQVGIGAEPDGIDLAIGDADTGLHQQGDNELAIFTDDKERVRIDNNGRMGIGDTSPTEGKLVVRGEGNSLSQDTYEEHGYNLSGSSDHREITSAIDGSIWAQHEVIGARFSAFSDERIKDIKQVSDSKKDLATINMIEITDYQFIDKVLKGDHSQKKVIAQQVEKVFPLAVSRTTDIIPNVYEMALYVNYDEGTSEMTIQTNKAHDFKVGDMVKVALDNGSMEVKVLDVVNDHVFIIRSEVGSKKAFVIGKYVEDFRVVDYEAISMLNVSATQELHKRIMILEASNEKLAEENSTLKAQMAKLARLEQKIEAMLKANSQTEYHTEPSSIGQD